jgi:hypothetical protein
MRGNQTLPMAANGLGQMNVTLGCIPSGDKVVSLHHI